MAAERLAAAILALAAGGLVIPAAGAAWAQAQPVVILVDPARKGPATDAVVRTVPEALARAAALRSRSQATAAIVIELAAGIHRIDRAIRIGADAGGRPGAPLVLRGAKDGIARLSGSVPLAQVKRPPPAAAAPEIRDRILTYRLPRAAAAVRSIEVQRIHSKPAPPVGLELFDETGALVPARWPDEGWAKVERRGGSPTRPGIATESGRAERWRGEPDLWIAGYFGEDWSFETLPAAAVPGAGTLALGADPLYRLRDGARFYVSHAAAELDQSGEWWRDREAGVVHVIPRGSRDIEASMVSHLLEIDGASDVRIENLTFERSRGDAIRVSGGTDVVVEGCTVRWVGGRGVVFEHSLRSGVRRSIISDTGEGGITLAGGDRDTLAASGLFAEDTIIRRFSRLGRTYKFAVEVEGVGARVAGNFIADAPHTAIRFQGNDHEIVLNEIANVATETSDAGAIYTGRDIAAQGTVVRHNFIHDIAPAPGFEVKGIYLDDMASGTTVEGNLFLRVQQPVFIGGGRDNTVRGNLFALSSPAVHIDGRGTSWPGPRIDDPANEVQIALRRVPTASPLWRARYPRLAALMEDDPAAAKRNVVADNALIATTLLRIEPDADLRRQAIGDNRTLDGLALGATPVEAAAREAQRASAFGLRLHRSYVSHLYLNPGIVPALIGSGFDVIAICDFSPTMMMAAATGFAAGIPVVIQTDAQPETDPGQWSRPHRLARRMIVPRCAFGIGASRGSLEVLERYGLSPGRGVLAPLAPGWDFAGEPPAFEARPFDLMFCGHLDEDRKGALFFVDVVRGCIARGFTPRVRVTGDGPLRGEVEARLRAAGVEAQFDGYLPQEGLSAAYASAKLFLFPSRGDPWGLVANEALQCGTPVIVSPHARAGTELVAPFEAGSVVELSVPPWVDTVLGYLADRTRWQAAQRRAAAASRSFSVEAMAAGFHDAFLRATEPRARLVQERG